MENEEGDEFRSKCGVKKSAAVNETVRILKQDVGGHYSMLTTRHVHAIVAENLDREQKARGRKRNREFEAFVWAKLMFVVERDDVDKSSLQEEGKEALIRGSEKHKEMYQKSIASNQFIVASCLYSYEMLKMAAREVQMMDMFINDSVVQRLTFSDFWVKSLLEENRMRRRKISNSVKDRPLERVVREKMKVSQDKIRELARRLQERGLTNEHVYKIVLRCVANFDETASHYAAGPSHLYCSIDQKRPEAQPHDDKLRFTSNLACLATGEPLPMFHIIKCSKNSKQDLVHTRTRVLDNQLAHLETAARSGETCARGWRKKEITVTLPTILEKGPDFGKLDKDKGEPTDHTLPYLMHDRGHVVTCQPKAWNDQIRMIMYIELVLKPARAKIKEEIEEADTFIPWQDNCKLHCTNVVLDWFIEANIEAAFYPENMTDHLQIMDLVVNRAYKQFVRRKRCVASMRYMEKYKLHYAEQMLKPPEEQAIQKHQPPLTTLTSGILWATEFFESRMQNPTFQSSVKKSFVKHGSMCDENFEFKEYQAPTGSSGEMGAPFHVADVYKFKNVNVVDDKDHEKPKIFTLDDDSDNNDSDNDDDVYNFGPEDMDEDDEYRSATTYCQAWFQSTTVFKEAINHIGDLFHDEGMVWKISDVVVEPSRSQVLYFRYYECGRNSKGEEIHQPPDSRSMYFESSVDEFEGGNAHDGESFFWDNREFQGSVSSGSKKRGKNSVLPAQTQAPKKKKNSAKSNRAEKSSS